MANIIENLTNVRKLKIQLTYEEAEKLEKDYTKFDIYDYLTRMENYRPLPQKNISVYHTLKNWHRKDNPVERKSNVRLPNCPAGHSNTYIKINKEHFYVVACNTANCSKQMKVTK